LLKYGQILSVFNPRQYRIFNLNAHINAVSEGLLIMSVSLAGYENKR